MIENACLYSIGILFLIMYISGMIAMIKRDKSFWKISDYSYYLLIVVLVIYLIYDTIIMLK